MPLQNFASEPISREFERSAKNIEVKVAAEKKALEQREKVASLRRELRDNTILLAARVEELETLAEQIPNVREDVIENTARGLEAAEAEDDKEDLFGISAVVAVASGIVYALTRYDFSNLPSKAKIVVASKTKSTATKPAATTTTKSTVVSRGLRNVYGNKSLGRGASITGVLAALVAGVAFLDSNTLSIAEISAIENLENIYLSELVSEGQAQYLTENEIEDALTKKYKSDPAFREAVLREVQVIVEDAERLNTAIARKKQEIIEVTKK